jgi:hypothetical protein
LWDIKDFVTKLQVKFVSNPGKFDNEQAFEQEPNIAGACPSRRHSNRAQFLNLVGAKSKIEFDNGVPESIRRFSK